MTINREMLAAYAQGQLNEEGRALVEAAIIANPALQGEIARHHALRDRLQAHFDPILSMPVPAKLMDAVRPSPPKADVVDLSAARAARVDTSRLDATLTNKTRKPAFTRWVATGGAMAAALAIGLIIGSQMPGNGPMGGMDGRFVAQGALDEALTTQPATGDPQPVHILLSLRDAQGRYCRVFQSEGTAGLACRNEGRWAIERLQSGGAAQDGQYRQAGSALGAIMALAQDMAPQGALSPEQEQDALKNGWK